MQTWFVAQVDQKILQYLMPTVVSFGQNLEISVIVCVVDQTSFIEGRTIGAQLGAGALLRKTPFV